MAISIIFIILFVVLSAIHIAGEYLEENKQLKIRTTTKPFLLPLLLAYYIIGSIESGTSIVWLIAIGLFFGFIGDVTLLKPKVPVLFMIGLGSFLIGHILYIVAFIQASNSFAGINPLVFAFIVIYVLVFVVIHKFLGDSTKEMKIPVIFYMIIILTMSFCSLTLLFSSDLSLVKTPIYAFIGSLCFIASDFLLANQLFKKPFKFDQAYIMLTYLVAQLLIAQAYL
mgnify:CR=1 FL=1